MIDATKAAPPPETRAFRMDPALLYSVIHSQAGSFSKAVLETIMNSVDAGASAVHITFDGEMFEIVDDGKGFGGRDEIERFFETFGTPHKEGDSKFGKFRMGRGQVMAYTRNIWRSGDFQMDVDVKNRGLEYILSHLDSSVKGCEIKAVLYEPMKPSERMSMERELTDMVKYVPIPVHFNGKCISRELAAEKWTHEDENAWYQLRPEARSLQVFNLGVLVRAYPSSQFGVGGIVTSRKQLEVNFARNDVLVSKCPVWKEIVKYVRTQADRDQANKPVKNESYRERMAERLMAGEFNSDAELKGAMENEKVFTDVRGRHLSVGDLKRLCVYGRGMPLTVAPSRDDLKAVKLHEMKMAIVLAPVTLERFGAHNLAEVLKRLEEVYLPVAREWELAPFKKLQEVCGNFEPLADVLGAEHFMVADNDLKPVEREVLRALQDTQGDLRRAWREIGLAVPDERELRAGESDTAQGWTDGKTYICINRNELMIAGSGGGVALQRFHALATLLVHEYLHGTPDITAHGHDAEFYEAFEQIVCANPRVGQFMYNAMGEWMRLRERDVAKMRAGDMKISDQLARVESAVASAAPLVEADHHTGEIPSPRGMKA